jgi:hypothetical protein
VRGVAPRLLAKKEVSVAAIRERILQLTGLSLATADRRARTLKSWARQLS